MKIKQDQLIEYIAPKLIKRFGVNTSLAKHPLPLDIKPFAPKIDGEKPVWSILTLGKSVFDQKVHGTGKTPQRALECAGLKGWVKDAEEYFNDEKL